MLTETSAVANVEQGIVTTDMAMEEIRLLNDAECLLGTVLRPYINGNQMLGAILGFSGRTETALLHVRQIEAESPADRLANLELGEQILVRIMVNGEGKSRKVWATEKGVKYQTAIERLLDDPEAFKNCSGKVHGLTKFGVFVELEEGVFAGHRGLMRFASGAETGRVKLGSLMPFKLGASVMVDVVEARLNENSEPVIRVENVRLVPLS